MRPLLKICLFIFLSISSAFAAGSPAFQKFEIVELNFEKLKENNKSSAYINRNKKQAKYALIISGSNYNNSSKSVVVIPVVLKKEKDYKGKFVYSFKNSNKTYIIFADKVRTINQNITSGSTIVLPTKEKDEINKLLENILT
jgi:mRNA-degrading endonuclease toxin of MazEF toxin-antitoxin module